MFNLVYTKPNLKKWKIFSNIKLTEQVVLAHIFGTTGNRVIFITSNDEVYALGSNYLGSIGIEGPQTVEEPLLIQELSNQKVLGISTGENHGLAYTAEGVLYTWGSNVKGQLGDGTVVSRGNPLRVVALKLEKIINAAAGSTFSFALSSDKKLWFWGHLPPLKESLTAVQIEVPGVDNLIYITSGWMHAVAISECGKVVTLGTGEDGKLTTVEKKLSVWRQIEAKELNNVTDVIIKVACGKNAIIAINQLGEVYAWGSNICGCLAIQASSSVVHTPTKVTLREPVTDIAASLYHQIFAAINQQTCNVFVWGLYESPTTVMRNSNPISVHCYTLFEAFCDLATPTAVRAQDDDFQDCENLTDADFVSVADLDLKTNLKSLADRKIPLEMFNNKEMSDITIKLNGSEIYAHKVILSYFSPHYKNMFGGQWKENGGSIIDMTNYNPHAYSAYIKFVYTGLMEELDAIDTFDLYLIAKEYGEERLAVECLENLIQGICVDNVALLFSSAWKNKSLEIQEMCIKEGAKNLYDVMLTSGFRSFTTEEWQAFCQLTAKERKAQDAIIHSQNQKSN